MDVLYVIFSVVIVIAALIMIADGAAAAGQCSWFGCHYRPAG